MTSSPITYLELGAERLFGIGTVIGDDTAARATMRTGSRSTGPDGQGSAGSLGVLVDDGLAYSIAARTPSQMTTVTTQLHLDVLAPIPNSESDLVLVTDEVILGDKGGYSKGRVTDEAGTVIALASLRIRFVPRFGNGQRGLVLSSEELRELEDGAIGKNVVDMLDATVTHVDGGADLQLSVTDGISNYGRNLHGGVSLCAAEIAGWTAINDAQPENPLPTSSVDIAYLRPCSMGSDVTFRATVIHRGRSLGIARVAGFVDEARPVIVATVTCQIPD
jgi:uncharacterized protein (TIGR00369 family)